MRPDPRRLARSVAGLSAALLLSVTLISTSSDHSHAAQILVAAVLVVSIADPTRGLLAVAAIAPFLSLRPFLSVLPFLTIPPVLPVVLAFLVGWLARQPARSGPRVPALSEIAAWLFAGFTVVSIFAAGTVAIPTVGILTGMAVTIAVVELLRCRPVLAVHLPLTLGISTALVVVFAVADRTDLRAFSTFAIMFCLAGGMTFREHDRARLTWVVILMAALAGCLKLFSEGETATPDIASAARWSSIALFVMFLSGALFQAYRGMAARPRDVRLAGCIAGILAFIVAQIAISPRADAPLVFFLVLGLMTALAGSNLAPYLPCKSLDLFGPNSAGLRYCGLESSASRSPCCQATWSVCSSLIHRSRL